MTDLITQLYEARLRQAEAKLALRNAQDALLENRADAYMAALAEKQQGHYKAIAMANLDRTVKRAKKRLREAENTHYLCWLTSSRLQMQFQGKGTWDIPDDIPQHLPELPQ